MRPTRQLVGLVVVTFLASRAPIVRAQAPTADAGLAAPPVLALPERPGVTQATPRSLTLHEAVREALEHNNDVVVARQQQGIARENVRAALGVFDPRVLPTFGYERTVTPVASAIGGASGGRVDQSQVTGGLQVTGRGPLGGTFSVDFSSGRSVSSNLNLRLNPQFPSALGGSIVQPLWRGRAIDAGRRDILLARRTVELTDAQLAQVVVEQLSLLENAYWELVFAVRNLDVQVAALEQARRQVESNERQVRAGTLAPIDVVEAQAQEATFRQNAATAQQSLTAAENRVKALMLAGRNDATWNQPILPSELEDRPSPTATLEAAVAAALARRPELDAIKASLASNAIQERFSRDDAKPRIDLVGSYSLAGLAGTTVPSAGGGTSTTSDAALRARLNELSVLAGLDALQAPPVAGSSVPSSLVGGYATSLSSLLSARYPSAVVQFQVELPIGNRTALANLARVRLEGRQLEQQQARIEQAIEAEVRNALQAVQSSRDRLDAAGVARRSAQAQYDSELRRFESGLSTVFLVLQRQTALVTAQGQELRARADTNQALAELDRATGRTLEHYGIVIE